MLIYFMEREYEIKDGQWDRPTQGRVTCKKTVLIKNDMQMCDFLGEIQTLVQ